MRIARNVASSPAVDHSKRIANIETSVLLHFNQREVKKIDDELVKVDNLFAKKLQRMLIVKHSEELKLYKVFENDNVSVIYRKPMDITRMKELLCPCSDVFIHAPVFCKVVPALHGT